MNEYKELLSLTEDEVLKFGEKLSELLGKEYTLGMTDYVCVNGTLSDGHEHLTVADIYPQCLKEIHTRYYAMLDLKSNAMDAQADLLEAQALLDAADTDAKTLRAEAQKTRAISRLRHSLDSGRDTLRQLKAFNKVRLELEPKFRELYPEGIEQAEPDHWKSLTEYKSRKRKLGYAEHMTHLPLSKEDKDKLGNELGDPDLKLWNEISTEFEKSKELTYGEKLLGKIREH